jgi:hypothetical protein
MTPGQYEIIKHAVEYGYSMAEAIRRASYGGTAEEAVKGFMRHVVAGARGGRVLNQNSVDAAREAIQNAVKKGPMNDVLLSLKEGAAIKARQLAERGGQVARNAWEGTKSVGRGIRGWFGGSAPEWFTGLSSSALWLGGAAILVAGLGAGLYWASHGDQAIGQTVRGTANDRDRNVKDPVLRLGGRTEPYGLFLAKNDVFLGQESIIKAAACSSVIGWSLSSDPIGKVATVQMVSPPFRDREDALKWYKANIESQHIMPLGLGTRAKFKFDGKEHSIDNAERF